jgi:hypothetical protein
MTRREKNELLTQTGPGTTMGDLFRRYWIPALMASELPEADCPPVRVQLLSERMIAFRDIAASPCGSAATKRTGCAALITAGNTIAPASA